MTCQRPCQAQDVPVLPLGVPQRLDLSLQLSVNGAGGLAKLLVDALPRALVGRNRPVLDVLQTVGVAPAGGWGPSTTRSPGTRQRDGGRG